MVDAVSEYLGNNWVEIVAAILSLIYLVLSVKAKPGLWIFGFLGSALYVFVFFEGKLYAEMSLQFYCLLVSVYGWFHWRKGSNDDYNDTPELPITQISGVKQIIRYTISTVAIFFAYYFILRYLTDSPIPVADSLIGALSIIATWMLAKKKIENWLVFIVVDAFAAMIYLFYKQYYPTTILFVIYTAMAVVGYFQWKKKMRQEIKG